MAVPAAARIRLLGSELFVRGGFSAQFPGKRSAPCLRGGGGLRFHLDDFEGGLSSACGHGAGRVHIPIRVHAHASLTTNAVHRHESGGDGGREGGARDVESTLNPARRLSWSHVIHENARPCDRRLLLRPSGSRVDAAAPRCSLRRVRQLQGPIRLSQTQSLCLSPHSGPVGVSPAGNLHYC